MAKLTKARQAERVEAIAELRGLLPEGATVYSIVRSVARSGMSREISFMMFVGREPAQTPLPYYLSRLFALAIGWRMSKNDRAAIVVHGCGMDMCFHTLDCVRSAMGYKKQFRSEQL